MVHYATRFVVFALLTCSVTAQVPAHEVHGQHGAVDFPISCRESSQQSFNKGMVLLHHMTYPQARQQFEAIIEDDPKCAMAHWGVAMTLFQPLWPTRPSPVALQRGWDEVQRAKSLGLQSERERQFVVSAEAFFTDPQSGDYWLRIRRWEAASAEAYSKMPNDTEIAVFYALAHLATTPSNANTREHADEAAAILTKILQQHPDHPGVMHYLVHANDVPGRERELLDVTRKYEELAPDNPHALHMPTHIYTRLGDWNGVIRGNLKAANAALSYPAGQRGEFVWDEFAHAIEYLVYAYLQEADDAKALSQVQRLRAVPNLEPSFKTAFHLASTQARYALERGAWSEAAQIQPRMPGSIEWDKFIWPEAIAQFARGYGAARTGDVERARAALIRIEELEKRARASGEDLFARNVQLLGLELNARLIYERSETEAAVQLLRQAAEIESATPKHPVTPGPTLPAFELLGDMYMDTGRSKEALQAYEAALRSYPRRFNSTLGAARAARASGNDARAADYYRQLIALAVSSSRGSIIEARSFIEGHKQPDDPR